METKFDVIITGAGLAGCTLGYLLKKQGKKVLIIEKQKLQDKDKLCGGILTEKSIHLLCEIFNRKDIEQLLESRFDSAMIRNHDINILVGNIAYATVYRKNLDAYVLNQYLAAGGEVLEEAQVKQVDPENKSLSVNDISYSYDFLAGADGVFSPLRQLLKQKRPNKNFSVEIYHNQSGTFNQVEFFFHKKLKGYGWTIPNKNNIAIGLGIFGSSNHKKINKLFDNYLVSLGLLSQNINKRGAYLPAGDDILLHIGDHIFFVGDSAGLIAPITGEGIYYALFSAKTLSDSMNLDYVCNMAAETKKIRRELFFRKWVYNAVLRNFLFSKYYTNKLIQRKIDHFVRAHILG